MNLLIFNLKTDADDSVLGFTTDWINALSKKCEQVFVITMMKGRLSVADNVKVLSVGKEKGYSELRRLLEFYRILWRVLRAERIDVCFAHMMPLFAVLGWPLLKSRNIPVVLWYTHSHVSLLLRLATQLVDRVVSASKSGFQINTHKVQFIGHGIDVARFSPSKMARKNSEEKLVLLTVGRLSPVKRLEVALEALAMLPFEVQQRLELRYVGDPAGKAAEVYVRQLRQQAEELSFAGVVTFHQAFPFHRVHEAYHGADVFINSSDTDSIDKAVLEAMSCGLVVITSNAAFRDVFGLASSDFVIPKNDPATLAKKIAMIAKMPVVDRLALGDAMRSIVVKNHSLDALTGKLISAFPLDGK